MRISSDPGLVAAAASAKTASENFELAVAGAALGTWDWNVVTGETLFNSRWAEMLEYRLECGCAALLYLGATHPSGRSVGHLRSDGSISGRSDFGR